MADAMIEDDGGAPPPQPSLMIKVLSVDGDVVNVNANYSETLSNMIYGK